MSGAMLLGRMDLFEIRLQRIETRLDLYAIVQPDPQDFVNPPEVVSDPQIDDLETQQSDDLALFPEPVTIAEGPAPFQTRALEQTIGLKWAGWIGAVVFVIGAAFGIRFAYDQGWFTAVTPAVRLGLLALGGAAMIGAGEWVYRKINVLSAVGLFGAGGAVLFVVSYAGHAYYGLYATNTAFAFMGFSTFIGAAVARRGKLVSIAVLSLIGGNLAPALLHQNHPQLLGFMVYLLTLQLVSLLLASWGATPKWWMLRGLSLATTSFWVLAVIHVHPLMTTFIFVLMFALLYQAELIRSASRSVFSSKYAGATFSALVTAGAAMGSLVLLHDASTASRLICVLAMAAMTGGASLFCMRRKSQSLSLASAKWIVFDTVLPRVEPTWVASAQLPFLTPNMGIAITVAPLFCLFGFITRNATGSVAYARSRLAPALIALLVLMWAGTVEIDRCVERFIAAGSLGLPLSQWKNLLWSSWWMIAIGGYTSVFKYFVSAHPQRQAKMLNNIWRLSVAIALKYMVLDLLSYRMAYLHAAGPVVFGPRVLAGVVVLTGLILIGRFVGRLRESRLVDRSAASCLTGCAVAIALCLGSFGIDQSFINMGFASAHASADAAVAEQVALSIFWSSFALILVVIGFARRVADFRYFGLALFGFTLLKVVTVDLSQISTGYRIMSFMGLGMLLLGTSVLYGKVRPVLLGEGDRQAV